VVGVNRRSDHVDAVGPAPDDAADRHAGRQRGHPRAGFVRSFSFAGQGVWYVIRTQRNMRVHLAAAACAIALGAALRIGAADWACVIIAIGLVLTTEALNTVAEALTDLCTAEFHPLAKIAKDAAAGAVLISSVAAVGVGIAVFVPRLINLAG
jgi:diacylglycerol kinase (ATP)